MKTPARAISSTDWAAAKPILLEPPKHLVHQRRGYPGRIKRLGPHRASPGEDVHDRERLEEGVGEVGEHQKEGDGAQVGKGNGEESPDTPGPIDFRGLIDMLRHILKGREVEHEVVAQVLPYRTEAHQSEGETRVIQPSRPQSEEKSENVVHQPHLRIEEKQKDRAGHCRGKGEGPDEQQPVHANAPNRQIGQIGDNRTDSHPQAHADNAEHKGLEQCLIPRRRQWSSKNIPVILQPDKLPCTEKQIRTVERKHDGLEGGIVEEHQQDEQGGHQQNPGEQSILEDRGVEHAAPIDLTD